MKSITQRSQALGGAFTQAVLGMTMALVWQGTVDSIHAQTVAYSANVIGIHRVDVPAGGVAMLSAPFVRGDNSLDAVIGTQAEPMQDAVRTWDGASYRKYLLFPPINDARSNTWVSAQNFLAAGVTMAPGTGIIFENSQDIVRQIVVAGDVVSEDSITIAIPTGIHLVSYPFSCSIGLNETTLTTAAKRGDSILVFDAQSQAYRRFMYFGEIPGDVLRSYKWLSAQTYLPTDQVLPIGSSFLYENNDEETIVWTEERKY